MNTLPIGILDSGVGGLTVWREIMRELPDESIIYIGDSAHTPYGRRSEEEIYQLSKRLIDFLLNKQVKLIVIACNTITVSSLDRLRRDYPHLPLIGTVPVIKTAAAVTRNKRIGILSTTRTAQSKYQKELIKKFAGGCRVVNEGTDMLVPLIEGRHLDNWGNREDRVLQEVLAMFQKEDVDVLALGCTHFPFLRQQMQDILGSGVQLLDSGAAIARQVRRVLEHTQTRTEVDNPQYNFYTTGEKKRMVQLLGGLAVVEGRKGRDLESMIQSVTIRGFRG